MLEAQIGRFHGLWVLIQKVLDESNIDYKDTAAWRPHSDCSDKRRTEFFK